MSNQKIQRIVILVLLVLFLIQHYLLNQSKKLHFKLPTEMFPTYNINDKIITYNKIQTNTPNHSSSQIFKINSIVKQYPCSNTDPESPFELASKRCEYQSKLENKLGIFNDKNMQMTKSELHLARLYINTIKLSITNTFYIQYKALIDGSDWPPAGLTQAITMVGIRRVDNLQMILEDIIVRGLNGDFIELGVWKGGICILATSIFHAYKQYNRRVFLADSFEGIPPANLKEFAAGEKIQGWEFAHLLISLKSNE